MASCGDKPRLVAFGVAPLGIVSNGVVPMGVVSIGVVPMGVVSLGVVGMGVLNACVVGMGVLVAGVNVMGVWWAGLEGMGPRRLGPQPEAALHRHHHPSTPAPAAQLAAPASAQAAGPLLAYPTRGEALEQARRLGCEGVHAMGSRWMACAQHPH